MHLILAPSIDPTIGPAATPIAFIRAIARAYERYGIDPANAFKLAQIAPSIMGELGAHVTASQMEVMSGVAMQELDDEALGWFARKLPWGTYGMLCRASITSPNLGVALKRWCRHHKLLTNDVVFSLSVERSTATVSMAENCALGEMRELCLVTCLRYILGYACWVIDSRIPLMEARFPYAAPGYRDVYPLMFPGPIHFNSVNAGFDFDVRYLRLPLRRDEHNLQQMLQRALPLTVRQYRRDRLVVQRVRQILRSEPEKASTAGALSELLHLSSRTLQRQLQEEGATLLQLKNEARRDRAIELLHKSNRSIKQVAQAVGYRSEKSFTRAFKHWTGNSPSRFRELNQFRATWPVRASGSRR